MTQPKPGTKLTVADYTNTPGHRRYQLLDGELILAPSPTTSHQRISRRILVALEIFLVASELGEVFCAPMDVVLSENDVAQPDILFVSGARNEIVTEANIQGAPDMVVEILSPGTIRYDRGYKLALYGRHGVRECWLVDPQAETVEVLTPGDQGLTPTDTYHPGDTLTSALLPGLRIPLAPVFTQ
jgi:Uma2 family endonuclease